MKEPEINLYWRDFGDGIEIQVARDNDLNGPSLYSGENPTAGVLVLDEIRGSVDRDDWDRTFVVALKPDTTGAAMIGFGVRAHSESHSSRINAAHGISSKSEHSAVGLSPNKCLAIRIVVPATLDQMHPRNTPL